MFDLDFTASEIPVEDGPAMPADLAPEVPEFACEVCGKELTYGGRGRKPKYCDEHKKNKPAGTRSASGSKRDEAVARQAAGVLSQINGLVGLGLYFAPEPFRMPDTAAKLDELAPKFEEQAFDALKNSPALARTIARAGGVSGSAGLIIAYGMLGASLAPVAVDEWKRNKEKAVGKAETK